MPRKRNQTQYDEMMSVFKQSPVRSEMQHDLYKEGVRAPIHLTSRTQDHNFPSTLYGDLPPAPAFLDETQLPLYADGTSSDIWNGSSMTTHPAYDNSGSPAVSSHADAYRQVTYPFDTPPSHLAASLPSTSSSESSTTSQWIVRIFSNGHGQELSFSLPAEKFQIPYAQCVCGVYLRFLHLPTLTGGWDPDLGVLWNFWKDEYNVWVEGAPHSDCVSLIVCPAPACRAQLRLYGPCS